MYNRKHPGYKKYLMVPVLPKQERPYCLTCTKQLNPHHRYQHEKQPDNSYRLVKVFNGEYGYEGSNRFCSQRCGYEYGLAVAKRVHP